jgi:hypothetical protein
LPKTLTHLDRAVALYNPLEHRALAARFGQDEKGFELGYCALARWVLGYPDAALADADRAIADARELRQAATLMYALALTRPVYLMTGASATIAKHVDELAALAEENNAPPVRRAAAIASRIAEQVGYAKRAPSARNNYRGRRLRAGARATFGRRKAGWR